MKSLSLAWVPLLLLLGAACTPRILLWPTGEFAQPSSSPGPSSALANPAAVYCQQSNGRTVTRRGQLGTDITYCVFTNLSACEEWSYYRGQCKSGDNPNFQ
jgi:putative hemolysin